MYQKATFCNYIFWPGILMKEFHKFFWQYENAQSYLTKISSLALMEKVTANFFFIVKLLILVHSAPCTQHDIFKCVINIVLVPQNDKFDGLSIIYCFNELKLQNIKYEVKCPLKVWKIWLGAFISSCRRKRNWKCTKRGRGSDRNKERKIRYLLHSYPFFIFHNYFQKKKCYCLIYIC